MPTLSTFYGIVIQMYWRGEHGPPHFHALYGEHEALIDIKTLKIIKGRLPRQASALVLKWAKLHQDELSKAWAACSRKTSPKQIAPLE